MNSVGKWFRLITQFSPVPIKRLPSRARGMIGGPWSYGGEKVAGRLKNEAMAQNGGGQLLVTR